MTETAIEPKPEERDTVKPKSLESGEDSKPAFSFPRPSGTDWKREPEKPASTSSDKPKPKRGRPKGKSRADIRNAIEAQLVVVGIGVSAWNPYDGRVIITKAPDIAKSLDALAQENEAVKRALEMALTASAWSQVILTLASVAVPIAANHGLAPEHLTPLFGIESPSAFAEQREKTTSGETRPGSVSAAMRAE